MRYFCLSMLLMLLGAPGFSFAQGDVAESAIALAQKETLVAKEQTETYASIRDVAGAQSQLGKITGLFVRSWMVKTEKEALRNQPGAEDALLNARNERLDAALAELKKANESLAREFERLKGIPGVLEVLASNEARAKAAAMGQVKLNTENR